MVSDSDNTVAYYITEFITSVKSFIEEAIGSKSKVQLCFKVNPKIIVEWH
jgi:hypothetical protein